MNCWRKLCAICPKLVSKSATRCPWTSKNAQPVEMLGAFLTSKFRHCFGIILRVWAVPAVILTFLRVSDVQLYYSHHSWYRQFHPKKLVSARWYQCIRPSSEKLLEEDINRSNHSQNCQNNPSERHNNISAYTHHYILRKHGNETRCFVAMTLV